MNNLIDDITIIAGRVCDNQLEKLRLEEELLISFIRKATNKTNLRTKADALIRVKQINKLQIKLLGGE
jgi:hypothetical protein